MAVGPVWLKSCQRVDGNQEIKAGVGEMTTDPFDSLLIDTCNIYAKGAGAADDYGQQSQALKILETGVKCRLSDVSPGREFKVDKQISIRTKMLFLRPQSLGSLAEPLNPHHVVEVSSIFYNISDVLNPSNLGHHLEVLLELIQP